MPAIETTALTKRYGTTTAGDSLDLAGLLVALVSYRLAIYRFDTYTVS